MPLDAQTEKLLKVINARGPAILDVQLLRQQEAQNLPSPEIERAWIDRVEERSIDGPLGPIPLRLYFPRQDDRMAAPVPLVMYLHGGGNTLGSLDSHDGVCCRLAQQSGCIVVAVGYRLAPEHKFPAAPEDCYAALQWIAAHGAEFGGDSQRIAVAGDSAGGNLAAVVCLMARDRKGPAIAYQVLIYPSTTGRAETASRQRNGRDYFLTIELMDWFAEQYFHHPDDKKNPLYAVIKAENHAELPPALVITAEYDPLLDDGELYAQCLADAGVPVEYLCYDGTIHGFVSFYHFIDQGKQAIALIAERLRTQLS